MNSLAEKKELIVDFWGIESEAQRDNLIEEILNYSELQEKDLFVEEVRNSFEQVNFSGISVIYEALSENPEKWSSFFLEEYKRAFKKAETSKNSFEILECLEEIGFVDYDKMEFKDELIHLLSGYLTNQNDVLRYKAIWLLGDWINKETTDKYSSVVFKIKERLGDENWKIRHIAESVLDEIDKLPKDHRPSFLDKLRRKYLNSYSM